MGRITIPNLPQKLSNEIVRYIIDENLQPGDRLPNEAVLSQKMSVGRSSVREAMKLLVSRNIVEIRQGSGTYVSANRGVMNDPLGLIFLEKDPKLVHDLMELRFLTEPFIAVRAARNAQSADIIKIRCVCKEVNELILSRSQDYVKADVRFHEAIAKASKNLLAPRLVPIIARTLAADVQKIPQPTLEKVVSCHKAIAEAISSHNEEAACDLMQLHLVYNRRILTENPLPDETEEKDGSKEDFGSGKQEKP